VPTDDFRLFYDVGKGVVGSRVVSYRPKSDDEGYFLLLTSPELKADDSERPKKTVILALDRSGSMSGKKIEQAKGAAKFVIHNLREGDLFNLIAYDSEVESWKPELQKYSDETRKAALGFIEGIYAGGSVLVTGNTVVDALFMELEQQKRPAVRAEIDASLSALLGPDWAHVPFVLITGHRRENFGEGIRQICEAIATLSLRHPDHHFVYPVHLNPNVEVNVKRLLGGLSTVRLIPPQGYRNFVALMAGCRLVLTDSGGVQEEAPSLGKPVLVMRETTERREGLEAGTARLVGPRAPSIVEHTTRLIEDQEAYRAMATAVNPYGDGHAAQRIVRRVRQYLNSQELRRQVTSWSRPAEQATR
jgi:hypothetical protein